MATNRNSQIRLFAILTFILGVLACSSLYLYSNFSELNAHQKWVAHTNEVLNSLDQDLSAVKEAENGVHGYLLTHKDQYLITYQQGADDAFRYIGKVRALTIDNPQQTEDADLAKTEIEQKIAILESQKKKAESSNKPFQLDDPLLMRGENELKLFHETIDRMKTRENDLLVARTAVFERGRATFLVVLLLSSALMTVVILISFIQINRGQTRALLETIKKDAEGKRSALVAELAQEVAGDLSFEDAGGRVLRFLTQRLNFLAAKLWYLQGDNLIPLATTGIDERYLKSDRFGPDLVKRGFERDHVWTISDVPKDYWQISSGLGHSTPNSLTLLPISFQGRRIGVVELGSFGNIDDVETTLAEMREPIGIGLNAAKSRSQLQEFLERTQQQSEELQAQQEELKANNEELEQQARALESQQQTLNKKNRDLEEAQADLKEKAEDLERSSQYKSDFLAKMSHELRTPLNGLLILSTLLSENKEKNLTDQQKQFARSINSAGNDLLLLINDILDLSKIEARKLSLRPETVSIRELFETSRRNFEPQTMAKGLTFEVSFADNIKSLDLFTDRQRLDQILRNFLSNAIKFTDAGKVTLHGKLNSNDPTVIEISVHDTGIGVPADKQQSIFEAFEQADGSVSRRYGGTGLGLTISRELAILLGGDIKLESEFGHGSTFTLRFPIQLPTTGRPDQQTKPKPEAPFLPSDLSFSSESGARALASAEKALANRPKNKKTILVVEDDAVFRRSIVDAVASYGFHPIETGDGEVALAILNKYTPDAVLLDIKLPGISGLGILEMAKQMPHLRHVPIHMISALEYQQNALRMGALGYLTKPVTIEKIHSALQRIENVISKKIRRVLLIEDDERQNQAVSKLIAGQDLEVVSVKTGDAAVTELRKDGFDCIILDLTLPDVSGFDLLSELRALDISLPPIVIYTGRDLSDDEERYLRKYSESIIIKGARSPERLLDEVNLFLHRMESLLPEEKREMLSHLRSKEKLFEGRTILVVDDDIRNIFALTSALEARGLQVRVARDGVEAIESLEAHQDIDLTLMDIMMPRMDGFEAIRRIRSSNDQRLRDMPIVALTAKAMREDHEKCMEAGASDYLPKPVNLDNLTTVLKVWLSHTRIQT